MRFCWPGGILVAALAIGCGGSDSDDLVTDAGPPPITPETRVTIAFLEHGNPDYGTANGAAFRAYERAHPNVTIQTTTVDFETLTSTLLADLRNDRLNADLLQVPGNWVCSFAQNVTDVPPEVVTMPAAQIAFFEAPLAGGTCDGVMKGVPVEYNLEYGGVVVNVDKYRARFPGKTPAWVDWRTFIAEAAALAEYDSAGVPKANGLDIDPSWPGPAVYIFFAQILQRGGQYWAPGGDRLNLMTPEARDTVTDMASWITQDRVMSLSLIPDRPDIFVATRVAQGATGYGWSDLNRPLSVMGYIGTWGLSAVRGMLPPERQQVNYDYFAVPPMVGNRHRFISYGGWTFAVPRTSRNQRIAWDIVKSLALDPAAMKQWSATTLALPALRENGTPEAAATDPVLSKVQPLLELGEFIGYMPAAAIQTMEASVLSNVFDVVRGSKTVDQALASMQQTTNDAFASSR